MSSELFTVCFWAGYEGNCTIFRLRVKRKAAVSTVSSSSRTRLQLGRESQRCYGGNRITESGRFTRELLLCNIYFLLLMFVKRD